MKTIIEMAREAGLHRTQHSLMSNPVKHRFSYDGYEENLEHFAALVTEQANARANTSWALMCKKMVEFEREAILELVDSYAKNNTDLAEAIRARGNT